jgi:hypothetical protein
MRDFFSLAVVVRNWLILAQAEAAGLFKPEALQRYVEDSAEASRRAKKLENTLLGQKMPVTEGHYAASTRHGTYR